MKKIRNYTGYIFLFVAIIIASLNQLAAQNEKKEKEVQKAAIIKNIVEAKHYIFRAETVIPMTGLTRNLTPEYDIKVNEDTVTSYLPYFGKAYSAPIDPTQGGIKFTSINHQYNVENGKKGGWNILIKPKDVSEVQQLVFNISENGRASLHVTSTNRQPISFNGYIEELPQKKAF